MESSDDDWMTSVRFGTEDANTGPVDFVSVISRELSCKFGFCVARLQARRSDFGVDRSLAVNFSPKCFMTTGLLLFRESRLFSVEIYERTLNFHWCESDITSTWVHNVYIELRQRSQKELLSCMPRLRVNEPHSFRNTETSVACNFLEDT